MLRNLASGGWLGVLLCDGKSNLVWRLKQDEPAQEASRSKRRKMRDVATWSLFVQIMSPGYDRHGMGEHVMMS